MSFDNDAIDAHEHSSADIAWIKFVLEELDGWLGEEVTDLATEFGHESLLEEFAHSFGGTFGGLKHDVAGIAIADYDIG